MWYILKFCNKNGKYKHNKKRLRFQRSKKKMSLSLKKDYFLDEREKLRLEID